MKLIALALAASALTVACTVETLVPGSSDPAPSPTSTEAPSASATNDAGPDAPAPSASGTSDAAPTPNDPSATSELRFSGECAPDLRDLVVATNMGAYDSIGVSNATAPAQGSVQIALVSGKRELSLSTKDRTADRDVVNVMAGGVVYTNLCNSSAGGCAYDPATTSWKNDPVAGKVSVRAYDPRSGKLDVTFDGVVLSSTRGAGLCRVSGSLRAYRLGR
jgi:hypothetical protein